MSDPARAALEDAFSRHRLRRRLILIAGVVVLICAVLASTGMGVQPLSPGQSARALLAPLLPPQWLGDLSQLQIDVVQKLRAPRTLLAAIGGASLALAGAALLAGLAWLWPRLGFSQRWNVSRDRLQISHQQIFEQGPIQVSPLTSEETPTSSLRIAGQEIWRGRPQETDGFAEWPQLQTGFPRT